MSLDHERLDVYHVALEFLALAMTTIDEMPRGRSHLADQLARGSTSIVLNIAEGVGKFSKPDKRRLEMNGRGKALLERIVAMLVKLVRHCE